MEGLSNRLSFYFADQGLYSGEFTFKLGSGGIMKLLLITFLFCFSLQAENKFTVEQLKKIINGKESKTISKEMQFFPLFKKSTVKMVYEYKDAAKDPLKVSTIALEKYIEGKYLVVELKIPNSPSFYSVIMWNDKMKYYESWYLAPDQKVFVMIAKLTKRKGRLAWEGKTPQGEIYKGYSDYSKDLISWEGKYYSPEGKFIYSESGNSVPVTE